MICHNPGDSIRDLFISRSVEVTWPPTFETVTQNHEKLQGRLVRRIARSTNLLWYLLWFNSWSSIINGGHIGHPRNTTQRRPPTQLVSWPTTESLKKSRAPLLGPEFLSFWPMALALGLNHPNWVAKNHQLDKVLDEPTRISWNLTSSFHFSHSSNGQKVDKIVKIPCSESGTSRV